MLQRLIALGMWSDGCPIPDDFALTAIDLGDISDSFSEGDDSVFFSDDFESWLDENWFMLKENLNFSCLLISL